MRVDTIAKVKKYIAKARELVPNVTNDMLDSNSAIYYMNGNDGTDFDWNCNDRLCEFMVFGKNEMGFVKVCVNKDEDSYKKKIEKILDPVEQSRLKSAFRGFYRYDE